MPVVEAPTKWRVGSGHLSVAFVRVVRSRVVSPLSIWDNIDQIRIGIGEAVYRVCDRVLSCLTCVTSIFGILVFCARSLLILAGKAKSDEKLLPGQFGGHGWSWPEWLAAVGCGGGSTRVAVVRCALLAETAVGW